MIYIGNLSSFCFVYFETILAKKENLRKYIYIYMDEHKSQFKKRKATKRQCFVKFITRGSHTYDNNTKRQRGW